VVPAADRASSSRRARSSCYASPRPAGRWSCSVSGWRPGRPPLGFLAGSASRPPSKPWSSWRPADGVGVLRARRARSCRSEGDGAVTVGAMENPYVERVAQATDKLLATTSRLDDVGAAGPSLLPIGTLHGADPPGRQRRRYPASPGGGGQGRGRRGLPGGRPARDAEIEAGRARPAGRSESACAPPASSWRRRWRTLQMRRGSRRPYTERRGPHRSGPRSGRAREVEVHHVDLGYGYEPRDWPFGWVLEEMDRAMIDLPSRLPPNVAVVLTASDAGQHWVAGAATASRSWHDKRPVRLADGSCSTCGRAGVPPAQTVALTGPGRVPSRWAGAPSAVVAR